MVERTANVRPGEIVAGRFELEKLAGRGGMGEVWRARDRLLGGRRVAIKRMIGASPDEADRFVREARVLEALRSPAIVEHVAHGRLEDGEPFLAMEWLDGCELADRLDHSGLSVDESITVARRIAAALAAAHAHGIVHRDVKPGNVFLPDERLDEAKLLDFGVAR
ncbi:MAG: protein kinase, partial [Deltaproteobacteria bacterium]|nr:protein kinase [Deltaproteobacteria bacterium]